MGVTFYNISRRTDPDTDRRLINLRKAWRMPMEYAPFWNPRGLFSYYQLTHEERRVVDSEIEHWLAGR